MCAGWVLTSNEDRGVLGGCSSAIETWVCAGWVLTSSGEMGVCLVGARQQWRHGCVRGGC